MNRLLLTTQAKDHPPSYEMIADRFAGWPRHDQRFAETVVPTNKNWVGDAITKLLDKLDRLWPAK